MDPWPRRAVGGLEGPNFVVTLQRQHHLIKPLQQAFSPARVYLETMRLSRRRSNRLRLEIDTDPPSALGNFDFRRKAIDYFLVDDDRQYPVLETVGKEDIAEPRGDHGADTHLLQRTNRPFA